MKGDFERDSNGKPSTLLGKFGFADKDRKDPRHDLAVAFACAEKEALRQYLWTDVTFENYTFYCQAHKEHFYAKVERGSPVICTTLLPEVPIWRPDLRSPSLPSSLLVGFADGVLRVTVRCEGSKYTSACPICAKQDKPMPTYATQNEEMVLLAYVEVKITPEPVGDIIRQIETYRSGLVGHERIYSAILLLDFDIAPGSKQMLIDKNITVIRLGPKFRAYIEEQTGSAASLELL